MKTMNTVSTMANEVVANETVAVKGEKMENKGLVRFNALSEESKAKIVLLSKELGNDYELLAGAIEFLNGCKKLAKDDYDAKAKERKEAEKELASANAGKLHDLLKVGDTVDYVLKSQKLVIKNVSVEKITEKRFHVELKEDTEVLMGDKTVKASEIANLKIGKKYVAFEAIQSVNGKPVAEVLTPAEEPETDEADEAVEA